MIRIRVNVIRNLRKSIYHKITDLDLSFFSEQRKGDLMSSLSNDVQTVEDTIAASLQVLFKDPIMVVLYFSLLFYYSLELTLFTLLILPISGFLISYISKKLKKESGESQQVLGQIMSHTEETISGIRIIKAFNAQAFVREKFRLQNDAYAHSLKKMIYKRELASPLTELIAYSLIVGIILYVAPMLMSHSGSLTPDVFITYLVVYVSVLTPAKNISNAVTAIQRGIASGERIFKILDETPTIYPHSKPEKISALNYGIKFQGVNFAYRKGDNGYVLQDINLFIPKGKTIALVGQSGSGKTTLSDLVARYYDPDQGMIFWDDIPLKQIDIENLRNHLGVVSQESILFNDTVWANIAFGSPVSNIETVVEAARIANAHDFIMALPHGYETTIGDRGMKLSGGQRQRLSIARAVYKNPDLLILDEATSALDTESERWVQEALTRLMKNRTALVIAHRLSTIRNADEIVVLDKGKIVQQGTHNSLISVPGVYKTLHEMQAFQNE